MKSFKKPPLCSLFFLIPLLAGACCQTIQSEPPLPTSVRGWHEFDEQGIHAVGEFVLRKGQSIENDKIGVELIKTIAPVKCNEPFAEQDLVPKALVRFYAIPGKQTLLEVEVRKGTSSRVDSPVEGINAIFVHDISTKDGWVWLEFLK